MIVMPAYKEVENIGPMIDELFEKEFPQITGAEMHLLVVNDLPADGSPDDGTGETVRGKMEKHKNLHILEDKKQGLGWAYIRGFRYAVNKLGADAVMEMDADFQHPPRFVKDMVAAYLNGADYAIGSRYIKGGSIPKEWALSRKAISYLGNLFIRVVLVKPKLHDLTTGFRLTRVRGVLDKIVLEKLMEPHLFAHKVDLLYQSIKNAKNVVEVPLEFASRTKEKSKFNYKEMIATFKVAIILGIKDKIRFVKFGTVGFLGYLVTAFSLYFFAKWGFPEWAVWALATELGIINNFALNNIWTFKDAEIKGFGHIVKKFLQFNLTSTGAIIIQTVVGTLGVNFLGESYRQIILPFSIVFLVMPYNYLMYNLVIWRTKL